MLFLAQAPSAEALSTWLGVGFYLIGGAGATVWLWRQIFPKPEKTEIAGQPITFRAHEAIVTLSQHTELRDQFAQLTEQRRKDVNSLHVKIEQGLENVRSDLAGEFKELRESQVDARGEILVLKTETASQTRQLHQLDNKIENLPEKILKLFRRE